MKNWVCWKRDGHVSLPSILLCALVLVFSTTAFAQVNERGLQLKSESLLEKDEFQDYEQRYAIVVGINKYKDLNIPSLEYATADAESIEKLLIEKFQYKPENIKIFLNEKATKANIMSAMYAFQGITENSQLLFYFAGHGETVKLAGGGEMGALLPYDVSRDQILLTGIRMNEIRDVTNVMAAKHQLFLIDACYGGLAAVTTRALDRQTKRYLSNLLASDAKQIITAGGQGETVIEKAEWGHSAFAKVLLDGLEKELADLDKNGLVTGGELATYMKPLVNRFSDNHQTPVYRKFTADEGEFIFLMDEVEDETQTQTAQTMFSQVSIKSNPSEATILINGQEKGTTPATVSLEYGISSIRLRKEGYADFTRSVEIQNPTFSLFAPLDKAVTQINVTANVQNAKVYIDGEEMGETPYTATRSHGLVKLEVRKEGYLPYEEFVLLDKDQSKFNVELDQSASIRVNSNPASAKVYLNGEYKGVTPLELSGIVREEYTLKVEKEGYPPIEQKVDLKNKVSENLNLKFKEFAGAIALVGMQGEADVTVSGNGGMEKSFKSLPVTSENLSFGTYNLEIRKKGFKPIVKKVDLDQSVEQVNILNDLKPKSKFGSIMLSMLIPGGGQFMMGKSGRGTLFLIAGAASGGYMISSAMGAISKVEDYKEARNDYMNTTSNFDELYFRAEELEQQKEQALEQFGTAFAIFGAVRAIEFLDNLLFPSPRKQLQEARVRFESRGSGVSMRLNF